MASVTAPMEAGRAAAECYSRIAATLARHRLASYGSAFSRGALIQGPAGSVFQLSGTAAIDERGKSLFVGDIRGQIVCTLDKVEALMAQVGADLRDIAAATVFVKRPEYTFIFQEIAAKQGLADLPTVCVVADVCRQELLFEIDAEAVIAP